MSSRSRLTRVRSGSAVAGHAGLEAAGVGLLEQQRRDQAHEVGVAAALAEPVERALHLPRAGVDGGERVRHRVAGVVVGVDAEPLAGDAGGDHRGGDRARPRPAACRRWCRRAPPSARRRRARPGGRRARSRGWPSSRRRSARRRRSPRGPAPPGGATDWRDVGEVLLERDVEGGADVEVVRLADEADDRGAGVHHRRQHVVVRRRPAGALGHAEGGEAGAAERRGGGEEGAVGGVGAGPAALDVVEAEGVEGLGDAELVLDGEVDALALLAVAEGGVEEGRGARGSSRVLERRHGRVRRSKLDRASHSRRPAVHDRDSQPRSSSSRIASALAKSRRVASLARALRAGRIRIR